MSKTFETDNGHAVTVYTLGSTHQMYITARNFRMYADAALTNKDAPAFALAVLEAAYKDEGGHFLAAIDDLRAKIRQDERAEDEKKLIEEAAAFREKFYPIGDSGLPPIVDAYWMNVARAARELHGK